MPTGGGAPPGSPFPCFLLERSYVFHLVMNLHAAPPCRLQPGIPAPSTMADTQQHPLDCFKLS